MTDEGEHIAAGLWAHYFTFCMYVQTFLFVCWVICFQSQNETNKLSPEVASILAAYLRNTRLRNPYHPSPATIKVCDQFAREEGQVFKE